MKKIFLHAIFLVAACFWLLSLAGAQAPPGQKPISGQPIKAAAPRHATATAPLNRAARKALLRALRGKIRHVFVIYQENRSFDSYFGTFPGADNLASPQARRHGLRQWDPLGHDWVRPFALRAADTADPHHDREALIAKADRGRMDLFVSEEEFEQLQAGASWRVAHQLGLLTMAHEDCHTIPYLWLYAHRFALYDHIFQGMYGPSTPGNIDLIAAQTGQTQWARHPGEAVKHYAWGSGEPVVNDMPPHFGPYRNGVPKATQLNQSYATLLLTLEGAQARLARRDNHGVRRDIAELARLRQNPVPWGWYQEGFGNGRGNHHPAYLAHHDAPQYFGYIRENQPLWSGVHGLRDFFQVLARRQLPARSVSFIKGGLHNPFGWRPARRTAFIQKHFLGDDDHPGYSDSQISEALAAKTVDAIAHSPYWKHSAIFLFWDDSGGFYDHVPPPRFETCPDHHPCGDGPRIPLILISPYARAGAIPHASGDHASFAKFLDVLFRLPRLASLPDEKPWLPEGPRDGVARLTNLLTGFDAARLEGRKAPLAARLAEIPDYGQIPPAMSCAQIGVEPVRIPGVNNHPPQGFQAVPSRR